MKQPHILSRLLFLAVSLFLSAVATVAAAAGLNLGSTPLYLGASVQPIVMLNLPRDHQLFVKAYNDFTDLDNDQVPDTSYKHTAVVYFGYFDAYKCYAYDTTNHRFYPINPQRAATATDRYCSDAGVQSTSWSGNFLNWVSMSRMDEIRKILYGGLRVVDTITETVIERAIIPGDVHAWAKYYDGGTGDDIKRITPFNLSNTPQTYTHSPNVVRSVTAVTGLVSITSIVKASGSTSSTTATVTTGAVHGLVIGSPVRISGASISGYNTNWTVTTVPTTTTFTITAAAMNGLATAPGGTKTLFSTTAVATVPAGHGYVVGQAVAIANVGGASAGLYNGYFTVQAVPGITTFSYVMGGQPTAAGSGASMTATQGLPVRAITSITISGTTATATTSGAHGLTTNTNVRISGATPAGYNGGPFTITVTSPTTFTYVLTSTPPTTSATTASVTLSANINLSVTNSGATRNILLGDQIQLSAGGATAPKIIIGNDNPVAGTVTITGRVTNVVAGSPATITVSVDGSSGGCTVASPCSNGFISTYTVSNLSSHGITICNLTIANSGTTENMTYNNNANPPLMRVVAGNYALWATTDGRQCRWAAGAAPEGGGTNGNNGFQSEIAANSNSPDQATVGIGTGLAGPTAATSTGQFAVRVKVCDAAVLGQEKCLQYPNASWKPVGLLQDYGSGNNRKIRFGLFTGSYSKNLSGGVLRKNPGFLDSAALPATSSAPAASDELDIYTGIFRNVDGMIKTLNNMRIYGFDGTRYSSGSGSDNCGSPGLVRAGSPLGGSTFAEGDCSSWGNPLSEMYSETLRFLAGKTANSAFTPSAPAAGTYSSGGLTKDNILGLQVQGWQDPLTNANYCAPLNVVVFNASVNSYDGDQVETQFSAAFSQSAKGLTQSVGTGEGIVNSATSKYLVGDKGNSVVAPTGDGGTCTPKQFDQANVLGSVLGICPEAPALEGSYLIAGQAWWAHTNKIRTDLTVPTGDARSLKVSTYGISLSGANPTIKIPVPGSSPTKYITILPAGRTLNAGSYRGTGSITEFKIVRQDVAAGTGKFFVSWEDSLQGNDYDLDQWGYISYKFISSTQIQVTTQVVYAAAGFSLGFGFVIAGTNGSDGVHYLSAHGNHGSPIGSNGNTQFDFTAADGTVECVDCSEADGARSRIFNVASSATASVLQEPLYYAAKYGSFNDLNNNGLPDQTGEWDVVKADGSAGTDGNPDNYFLVTNPTALNAAMDKAFIYILQVSSASSVATNSTTLTTGSRIYQARFNSNEWSGQLLAFDISVAGVLSTTPSFDSGQLMPAANSRVIVTYNAGTLPGTPGATVGIPFRWANITNAQQQAYLNTDGGSGVVDSPGTLCTSDSVPAGCTVRGQLRVNYLRGDQSNEGATATRFRVRASTVLGDIVTSTPNFVGPPSSLYPDASYTVFRSTYSGRTPMLFVGGNDGMLHAFEATAGPGQGVERLAYVPNKLYPNLTRLTSKVYSHTYYVDGSPTVADACFNTCASYTDWKTVLVGGYNAGGQGYFALNVTDPNQWNEGNANSIVMWEFTDANDPDVGNSYSKPVIVKMANGRWAMVFGNGYNSSSTGVNETACTSGAGTVAAPYLPAGCTTSLTGKAALFIVYLSGPTGPGGTWVQGTDYIKILTSAGTAATPNGLASPLTVDVNNDGLVDFVYGGDLLGNLWKFDVSSGSASSWAVDVGGQPLFIATDYAGNTQAITTKPLHYHTTGGEMILFGTGKYLETSDDSSPYKTHSFYGILDPSSAATSTISKTTLMKQKVLGVTAANPTGRFTAGSSTFRLTSAYVPNYTGAARTNVAGTFGDADTLPNAVDLTATTPAQNGWYIDFPNSGDGSPPNTLLTGTGEMAPFDPLIATNKLVFTTLIPSTVPCDSGGTSFLMDIDPVTGSRLSFSPFDVNGDNNFSSGDYVSFAGTNIFVSGVASTIGITPTPTVISSGAGTQREVKCLSGSSGAVNCVPENNPGAASSGARPNRRISWREILSD